LSKLQAKECQDKVTTHESFPQVQEYSDYNFQAYCPVCVKTKHETVGGTAE